MKVEKLKESNNNLRTKSFQMRIEFIGKISEYEDEFVRSCEEVWKTIQANYFWHIGVDFVDGFFYNSNNSEIDFDDIILVTLDVLNDYKENISRVIFKDIN